jgi:hypothetical protein
MNTNRFLLRAIQVLSTLVVFLSGAACISGAAYMRPSSPTIYTDQLGAGWEDWSWDCDCDFRSTTATHDGKCAIAVDLSGWGGLGIGRHSPVSTADHHRLEFYIHGGKAGGQQLRISLEDKAGHELPAQGGIKLNDPLYLEGGQINAGMWQRVTIPLADLGATDTMITKVNIMDNTGGRQPTFYIDDVALAKNDSE